MLPRNAKMLSSGNQTTGNNRVSRQQTHAISTSLPSLHDLSCSGKMSICLHCGLLSQECQCERAEYDSFQRHALGQNRRMLEDIELGGRGMVRMLDLVGSPDL